MAMHEQRRLFLLIRAAQNLVVHGHIDGVMNLVSPADAAPLKLGLPNGVVSDGRVGVTEIVSGRLQFRMLEGKMAVPERRSQQQMLNDQQTKFHK